MEVRELTIPQPSIKVDVQYLNAAHKAALLRYPTAQEIESLVTNGIEVPTTEFLTHYLFFRKRPGKEGWRNYQQVGQHIGAALGYLEDWVEFNGTSIRLPSDIGRLENAVVEHIGESVGLSVVNRIHGLTEADWDYIPTKPGRRGRKTLDFQVASDGSSIVQVETKGSTIVDPNGGIPLFTGQDQHIAAKKVSSTAWEQAHTHSYSVDARYGTITQIGSDPTKPVRCFLLDPPSDGGTDAQRVKLIQRLRFVSDWVTFLSSRSQLAAALSTRVEAIERVSNPFDLEGVELLRGNGKPFDIEGRDSRFGYNDGRSSFYAMKSYVTDGPDGGVVVPLPNGDLFFLGIRTSIIQMAADQKLEELMNNREPSGTVKKSISCVVNKNTSWGAQVLDRLGKTEETKTNHVRFTLNGTIHYAESGELFGVLPISSAE